MRLFLPKERDPDLPPVEALRDNHLRVSGHNIQRIIAPLDVRPIPECAQPQPLDRPLRAHRHLACRAVHLDAKLRVPQEHGLDEAEGLRPVREPREDGAALRVEQARTRDDCVRGGELLVGRG